MRFRTGFFVKSTDNDGLVKIDIRRGVPDNHSVGFGCRLEILLRVSRAHLIVACHLSGVQKFN